SLDEFVAVLTDRIFVVGGDIFNSKFGTESFVAENDGFVFDEIDDAAEGIFGSERKLDRDGVRMNAGAHHIHATLIISARPVHLVHKGDSWNPVFIGLPPHRFRLRLDATN